MVSGPNRKPVRSVLEGSLKLLREIGRWAELSLYDPLCAVCGRELVYADEAIICRECRDRVRLCERPRCRRCGKFMENAEPVCGGCRLRPPPFTRHVSYAAYETPLREIILLYKYGEIEPLKKPLAGLFVELHRRFVREPVGGIVPVPADKGRHREYEPLERIGRLLSRRLRLPLLTRALVKVRSTPPQAGLSQAQRLANLDGAFRLGSVPPRKGQRVLLIDDVYTTGTTIRRCAAVLRRGGVSVIALTLAQSGY